MLVFCRLLLWHDSAIFWNDDYQISILPVFADVARSWSEGHLPLLSPYSWVCGNLAGEFQYGTFSLFINAAVVLIWKLPLAFAGQAAALAMAHLFVLAAGAFLLARDRGLTNSLATMVALVAALNGWMIGWGATDWFGALGAFAWLPWAWWSLERALDPARSRWRFLWPAPFVYLLITGGFPYTVLMLALVAAWLALKSLGTTRRLASLWPWLAGLALGFGLAAPAWLALLDYIHGSARGQSTNAGAHWQWLVPPAALPGFLWPGWTVAWVDFGNRSLPHVAVELAGGTVPPLALLAGLFFLRGEFVRRRKWELGLLALVLAIAMLPSANVFRWSFRWLPLLHLVLALVAAEALAQFRLAEFWRWLLTGGVFASLLATYLLLPTNAGVPKYSFSQSLTRAEPLDPARLYLSVYPPPEEAYRLRNHPALVGQVTRPGSTAMWAGVRLINGYSPIRPAGVGPAWTFYTHGEIDPGVAEYLLQREAGPGGLLENLGIDGLLVDRAMTFAPAPASAWRLAHEEKGGRVYARVGTPIGPLHAIDLPNEKSSPVTIRLLSDARQKVVAEVAVAAGEGSAALVFARPFFDGYQATLAGEKIAVVSYRGLAPIIKLPAGAHGRLTMVYRPCWLVLGGALAALAALVMLIGGAVALHQSKSPKTRSS
ncbi:MAG: hypothetical protein ACR2MW_04605 [Chthoniobacterales bacterium]